MSSPVTSLTGMFMLWWAWLGFNCGSTFGVSGRVWRTTALVAVTTLQGAIGGGLSGLTLSMALHQQKIIVEYVINSILGGLVAVTGIAPCTSPIEAILIGTIGGITAIACGHLLERLKIDDPVGAIPVHMAASVWGVLAVGFFSDGTFPRDMPRPVLGLFHGGGLYQLGIQLLGILAMCSWSTFVTLVILLPVKYTLGIRMRPSEESLGADFIEHDIKFSGITAKLDDLLREMEKDGDNDLIKLATKDIVRKSKKSLQHRIFSIDPASGSKLPGVPRKIAAMGNPQTVKPWPVTTNARRKTEIPEINGRSNGCCSSRPLSGEKKFTIFEATPRK